MAITQAQFQTELDAAKTALSAGDFGGAKLNASLAAITLSGLMANASTDGRSFAMQPLKDAMKGLTDAINFAESASSSRPALFARARITGMGR